MKVPILLKLLVVMLVLTIVPLSLLGYYSLQDEKFLGLNAAKDARAMGLEAANSSKTILMTMGEQLIQQKAYDHARQMEIFITYHPSMTVKDLQNDSEFQKIAVQPTGKFGNTGAIDSKTLVYLFNSDQRLINIDTSRYSTTPYREILKRAEGGIEAGGYYLWQESDGSVTERYMYIAPVNVSTADGVKLASVATANSDQSLEPAIQIKEKILSSLLITVSKIVRSTESMSTQNTILTITVVSIIIVVLICFFMADRITLPIKRLTKIASEVSMGDLRTEITIHTNDEINDLAESFSRMIHALFEQTPEAIVLIDADTHRFVDANTNAEKLFGCNREQLLRYDIEHFYSSDQPDGCMVSESVDDHIRRVLAGELLVFERKIRSDEGINTFCDVKLVKYPSSNRNLIRSSYFDITERKRTEHELMQYRDHLEDLVRERTDELAIAKEKAETANKAKSVFLSNMSHELRTPLNGILGYAQILSKNESNPDTLHGLAIIRRSGEHLLTLINDILDIAKIEAGKIVLSPSPINLPAFIDGLQSIVWTRAEEKGIGYSIESINSLPPGIVADETRLRQILLNILGNAIKFTDTGQVVFRIINLDNSPDSSSFRAGTTCTIRFEIEDSGIGIQPELIDRIFKPFEQVSDITRQNQGTGLGLAISNQLTRLMGNTIQVRSIPGKGSTFWFDLTFPVITEISSVQTPKEEIPIGYEGKRVKILVVDDIAENRSVVADLLRPLGFEVLEATNGEEGVACTQRIRPDLILMDLKMPIMNGYEAVHTIRGLPEISTIPVIAMSASVDEGEQIKAHEEGFDGFCVKPIVWSEFTSLLKTHLMISWMYKEKDTSMASEEQDEMIPPPVEVLMKLAQLTRIGDIMGILEVTHLIEASSPDFLLFSRTIRKYAEGFELKKIQALINRFLIPEESGK